MKPRAVAVLGGGVAGMSAAVLLARDGHHVTLIERDRLAAGAPLDAPSWQRRGIPHFLQPHAFIPRGCVELAENLPDVSGALLAAGANPVDLRPKLPGPTCPEDEDLRYLAVRRPLIEWALRRAVANDTHIRVLDGAQVSGITLQRGRIAGAEVNGASMDAEIVVDALGRRSPVWGFLQASGVHAGEVESTDCGVIYYSRYYRLREGFDLPEGPWLLSPRGDLGYMAYATFPGDNRTFAGLLAAPPGVGEWRLLRDVTAFQAAVAQIPALRSWVDPDGVEPMTDVMPMAGLRNTIRRFDPTAVVGVMPVGDALCHTDPVLAHGLAFALIHAASLAAALREHDEDADAGARYIATVSQALEERFAFASNLDEQRQRMWLGGPVDFAHRDGDYALFSMTAGGAAATVDPDVFRMFVRRIGLLDSTRVLDDDYEMQRRVEDLFGRIAATPRPPLGPQKGEMVEVISQAGQR